MTPDEPLSTRLRILADYVDQVPPVDSPMIEATLDKLNAQISNAVPDCPYPDLI